MEGLLRDIRYSVRSLRKRPAFSLLVVLVLAVAIAANSSIFSIMNAVILKRLSFKEPTQSANAMQMEETGMRAQIRMTCNKPGRQNENETCISAKPNFDAGNG